MCLLKEIVPQFGIPIFVGSDNRLAFVAEVVKLMSKGLGITWKQHMAYCLWSSGKVECMNRTVKLLLGKQCQEIHLKWDQLLPITLLGIRSSPTKWLGLSLFEILFWLSTPFSQGPARGP
jgi:hypothetical protein